MGARRGVRGTQGLRPSRQICRRELFFKVDAATLKDLGVLDPILRWAILTSVGSTGDTPNIDYYDYHPNLSRSTNALAAKPAALKVPPTCACPDYQRCSA